jgi:hypothetical protein
VADPPQRIDRVVEEHRLTEASRRDRCEHHGGDPELHQDLHLAEVGVADDHVKPAIALGIGVRLVAGVDDRALQGGLEPHLLLEEVGAGTDLVVDRGRTVLGADLAGAGEDLAADEPREQIAHERHERDLPADQVVLVAAVGCLSVTCS